MANNIQWISLVNRNFTDIKSSLLNRLTTQLPEVTDRSSSNIFIVIIDILSGLSEKLNYYIDHVARESFVSTARLETSMYKKAYEFGYNVKASLPATAVVRVDYIDSTTGDPIDAPSDIVINQGTIVGSESGIQFITTDTATIATGYRSAIIPVAQLEASSNIPLGNTDGTNFQQIQLPENYSHGTASLIIDGTPYKLVDLFFTQPTEAVTKVFVVNIIDNIPTIILGDDYYAIKPAPGLSILADYRTTLGSGGSVDENTLTNIDTSGITIPAGGDLKVNNPTPSLRGLDIEDIEDLRKNIPLFNRTGDRAVSIQDFIDTATVAPGVLKSDGEYTCEDGAKMYIVPRGGGIANIPLIDSTKAYVDARAAVGTHSTIKAAGETHILIEAEVNGRYLMQAPEIERQIKTALVEAYNVIAKDINDEVHISDIIAIIDNQPAVDYLKLIYLTTKPFIRPISTNQVFDGYVKVLSGVTSGEWSIRANTTVTPNEFQIYEGAQLRGTVTSGSVETINGSVANLEVSIDSGFTAANDGDVWYFKTYPYSKDIDIIDYSIPVMVEDDINLIITTH